MIRVGEQIREIRIRRGYNQEQLAELASLNRVTIAKYESGKVEPGAQALARIADALEVSVDELLGRAEESADEQPQIRTPEAKILSAGIDRMPEEARERALNIMRLTFQEYAEYFKNEE